MKNISLNIQLFSSNISTSFKEGDYNAYGDLYSGYISISSNLSQSITTATSLKVNNVEYVGLETSFFSWADQIGGDIVEIPVFKNGNYNIKTIINEIEYDNVLSITQIKTENIPTRTLRKKNLTTILRGSVINSLDNETDEMNAPSIAAVNEKLKNLDVQAGDGVPTNSVVGFNGDISAIPEGYEIVNEDVTIYSDQVPIGTELDYYGTTIPAGYEQVQESSLSGNSIVKYLTSSQTISTPIYTQVGEAVITLNTTGKDIFVSFGLCCSNSGGSPRIGILVDDEEKFEITDSLTAEHIESRSTLLRNIPAGKHTFKLVAHKGNAASITISAYTSYHLSVFEI